MQPPKTVKQLQKRLGHLSYFRQYIPNFAAIAQPLHKLLKKGEKLKIETEHLQALQKLKDALSKAPILMAYDETLPLEVHTDGSNHGIGAAIYHVTQNGRCPIGFYSRSLTPAEQNYSTTEIENLAVVFALQQNRHYVFGRQIKVFMDHASLTRLRKN